MTTTLIVSDIHLGARNSQGTALLSLLETDYDRLILNGDTVDHLNFKKFRPQDWAVLSELQAVAQERELVLIRGNHDGDQEVDHRVGPLDVLARLLGVDLHEEYVVHVDNRRYLVLHGDQFDRTLNLTHIGFAAEGCYKMVQRYSRPMARWLKGCVKQYCGVVTSVTRGAVEYARRQNCDGVITGHTHYHEDMWVDGVHFLNTGCWVDWPCTYLMSRGGRIELCTWNVAGPEKLGNKLGLAPTRLPVDALENRPASIFDSGASIPNTADALVAQH
jgi:UDP-2,3-diacylglucosamine pyrophosphatase LpxH